MTAPNPAGGTVGGPTHGEPPCAVLEIYHGPGLDELIYRLIDNPATVPPPREHLAQLLDELAQELRTADAALDPRHAP